MKRQEADIEKMKAANITGDKLTNQEKKIKEGTATIEKQKKSYDALLEQ
jgi:hypothetical protein